MSRTFCVLVLTGLLGLVGAEPVRAQSPSEIPPGFWTARRGRMVAYPSGGWRVRYGRGADWGGITSFTNVVGYHAGQIVPYIPSIINPLVPPPQNLPNTTPPPSGGGGDRDSSGGFGAEIEEESGSAGASVSEFLKDTEGRDNLIAIWKEARRIVSEDLGKEPSTPDPDVFLKDFLAEAPAASNEVPTVEEGQSGGSLGGPGGQAPAQPAPAQPAPAQPAPAQPAPAQPAPAQPAPAQPAPAQPAGPGG